MSNDRSDEILMDLDPAIRMHAYTMLLAARQAGIPLKIISGRRTPEQNRAAGGAPGSYHLRGMAFDVEIQGFTREQLPYEFWKMLGQWAETNLGLTWGGRFVHKGVRDVNHFDLRNLVMV